MNTRTKLGYNIKINLVFERPIAANKLISFKPKLISFLKSDMVKNELTLKTLRKNRLI